MRTMTFRRARAARHASTPASSGASDEPADAGPSRLWRWWQRHGSAVLLVAATAAVGGGIVRMMTDATVVRVVTFDEP